MSAPFVSVIIINYNSGDRLKKCLAHLHAQTFTHFEVIVLDNASSDGSQEAAAGDPSVQLVRSDDNLGFAAGNNLAVKSARGEWLAFLNPDAYARENWLEEFVNALGRWPRVDAFGSAQLDAARPDIIDGAGDVVHGLGLYYRGAFGKNVDVFPDEGECFSPCAAAAFYRRSMFDRLGGFDERFFCYGEDVDLGWRLRRLGARAIQLKQCIVHHEGSGVTGRRSDFSLYHGVRNRIWVYYKNMPSLLYWALAPSHALINLMMLARCVIAGEGSAYWRGLVDGFMGLPQFEKTPSATSNALSFLTWSPIALMRRDADVRKKRALD